MSYVFFYILFKTDAFSVHTCVCATCRFPTGVLQPCICCFPSDPQMCVRISLYSSLLLTRGETAAEEADLQGIRRVLHQFDWAFSNDLIMLRIWPETQAYSA